MSSIIGMSGLQKRRIEAAPGRMINPATRNLSVNLSVN
jgi:hypothetical protein